MSDQIASSHKPRKTLIFHLGDRKTGSTSIQEAFAQQQVQLKESSIFYPEELASNWLGKHFKSYEAPRTPVAREKAILAFRKFGQRLQEAPDDYCLISAEAFENVSPVTFGEVLNKHWISEEDDVRIIAYVRPHAARILSSFAETIKIGGYEAFESDLRAFFERTLKAGRFYYHPRFSAWREQFGDRFMLRPMIPSQLVEKSVVRDFVHYAFGQRTFNLTEENRANESLCLEDLMRLKVIHRHMGKYPQALRNALGWEFSRVVNTLPPTNKRTKLILHKSLSEDIYAEYLDDARAMDRDFFDGRPLLEAELQSAKKSAVTTAQSIHPEDYLSLEELRSLKSLATIMASLFENRAGNWAETLRKNRITSR